MSINVVLVTGATGFIGAEVVKQLLDRGYTVRAAVRKISPESTGPLEALAAALPGKLELQIVPDILADAAYDEAVKGVHFIIHCASPVLFGTGDPAVDQREVVDPAVQGATNILQSVARHGKGTVKRVVVTSSNAAIRSSAKGMAAAGHSEGDHVYTEHDWNTYDTIVTSPYHYSKTQAEKAAWQLADQHDIDLVTILPSLVLGPVTIARNNFSVDNVKDLLEKGKWFTIERQIDVRNVADAHIKAFLLPSAKGRYIISLSDTINHKPIQEALQQEFPDIVIADAVASVPRPIVDSTRAQQELGINLIPATTMVVDQARTEIQLSLVKPILKTH